MTYDYDLIVIGAGPAGLAAAKTAAHLGVRVAIVEKETVGGTCVNLGCIPKKLIVYAADFALKNEIALSYAWSDCHTRIDWTLFLQAVHKHIDSIHHSYQQQLQTAGIEVIRGQAMFMDNHTLDVNESQVTADKILIAVGSSATKPNIPGIEYAITSREMFHLPYLPERFAVLGGGYIGIEFASIMSAFGSEVTVIDSDNMILSGFDEDIRASVQAGLSQRGIRFINNNTAHDIRFLPYDAESFVLNLSDGCHQPISADTILVATGRTPNTKILGLENVGVKVGKDGEVVVDEYSRTSQDNIFAVGDCTNRIQLTPVARAEGVAFANTVFGNQPQKLDYAYVPTAVFSRPEAASVGMTQEVARDKFGSSIKCYRKQFQPLLSALTQQPEPAIIKLVVEGNTERVLGVHMVGEHAAEIIQSLAVAIRQGITKSDLDASIGIHPTTGEELFGLH